MGGKAGVKFVYEAEGDEEVIYVDVFARSLRSMAVVRSSLAR